jgi:hypothetical protein
VRGHRNGRHVATAHGPEPAHLSEQLVAVLVWHRDVAHDDVRPPRLDELERLGRGAHRPHLGVVLRERDREQLALAGLVVGDEDPHAVQPLDGTRDRLHPLGERLRLHRQGDPERRRAG